VQVGAFLLRGFWFLSMEKYENTKNVAVMSSDVRRDTCLFREGRWCHMRMLTCGIVLKLDNSRIFCFCFWVNMWWFPIHPIVLREFSPLPIIQRNLHCSRCSKYWGHINPHLLINNQHWSCLEVRLSSYKSGLKTRRLVDFPLLQQLSRSLSMADHEMCYMHDKLR
jgi:hypothetical protein